MLAQIQQYVIISLFVVVAVSLGVDYISGMVEAASLDLSNSIANAVKFD
jgi:hypothetical protein